MVIFFSATCRRFCINEKETKSSSVESKKNEPKLDELEKEKMEQQRMDEEEAKKRDSTWRTMKYSFIAFGTSFGLFGSYMIYQLGKSLIFVVTANINIK